jgi:hypothetical protein
MDRWDVLIVAVAAYVAVMTLVRLMARRRNELVGQVRQQLADLQKQKKKAAKQAKKDAA